MTKSAFTLKYDRFRQTLILLRKQRGVTQADVAYKLGRPQSFVSKYERGERRLDLVEFLSIAKALDVDPVDVIRELEEETE
ncbi:MAG: helix-turn-helix transcriptional regulator [Desulfarculus sp.]|nr:helix-turn-helix transcriptional regulator [Desulfarculus sp.]